MTVKELKEKLNEFPDGANVQALIFSNGTIYRVDFNTIEPIKATNVVLTYLRTDPVKQADGTYLTHICGLYD